MTQPGTLPVLPSPRFPKDQLIDIFKLASGVQVVWSTAKRPFVGQKPMTEKAWLLVGIQSLSNIDIDELRYQWNPRTNNNDSVVAAHRYFTTTLRAMSLDPKLEAYDLLERVRFRLRTPQIVGLFNGTLALRDIQAIRTLPEETADNRVILAATMDVRWKCVFAVSNMGPDQGGIIESDSDDWGKAGTLIP